MVITYSLMESYLTTTLPFLFFHILGIPGISDISTSPNPSIHSNQSDELEGYDWLEDIDKHKDFYRLKVNNIS